jgi:hypothetical protein
MVDFYDHSEYLCGQDLLSNWPQLITSNMPTESISEAELITKRYCSIGLEQ